MFRLNAQADQLASEEPSIGTGSVAVRPQSVPCYTCRQEALLTMSLPEEKLPPELVQPLFPPCHVYTAMYLALFG